MCYIEFAVRVCRGGGAEFGDVTVYVLSCMCMHSGSVRVILSYLLPCMMSLKMLFIYLFIDPLTLPLQIINNVWPEKGKASF